jgi:prevent-host-death family protein
MRFPEVLMRYSTQIKPISYVKAHAAELLDRITQEREPIIITQNGEARAVLVDVHSYEESQETMALLQILAIGGKTYPIEDVIAEIRGNRSARNGKAGRGDAKDSAPAKTSVAR